MELTQAKARQLYKLLLRARRFEEKVLEMSLAGALTGFVHSGVGQEAIGVGACVELRPSDSVMISHRGFAHALTKGIGMGELLAELGGKSTGCCGGKGGTHLAKFETGVLGISGSIGGAFPIAIGAAMAARYKGVDDVVVCFFGDGAANRGTFHEAANLASIWNLPVVFLCENNGFGMSMPTSTALSVERVAQRAAGYSMPGTTIDGNNILAVYEAVSEAVARARRGEGPALVECMTYRMKGHFVADQGAYQSRDDLKQWRERDPLRRFQDYLLAGVVLTDALVTEYEASVTEEIAGAVRFFENSPFPERAAMFEGVSYA
ncbi:MAG TPA: thiamine pyrophosphate-dependent dehydrogenase E1 component subunit alpha [Acidobacteriaceae bacterium]